MYGRLHFGNVDCPTSSFGNTVFDVMNKCFNTPNNHLYSIGTRKQRDQPPPHNDSVNVRSTSLMGRVWPVRVGG